MNRRTILLIAIAFPWAHLPAHACESSMRRQVRIEGAVTAVDEDRIEMSFGRRSEAVLITERTRILQRGADMNASVLKPGDRLLVQGERLRSGQVEAREIRIGERAASAPSRDASAGGGHKH
jgi:hypothetical protein